MAENICPHCGAKMVEQKHGLSGSGARMLRKWYEKNGVKPGLLRDADFKNAEYSNFGKLQHWGLIQRIPDKEGKWVITKEGHKWLLGDITLPKYAITYRGELRRHEGPQVHVETVNRLKR